MCPTRRHSFPTPSANPNFPDVYSEVAKFLDPTPNADLLTLPVKMGTVGAAGALAAVGATLVAGEGLVVGAGMAGLMAMLGVGSEEFASYGRKVLSEIIVPPPTDEQVFSLTAWAAGEFYKAVNSSPNALQLATALHTSGHLVINPLRNAADAKSSLPASIKNIIATKASNASDAEMQIRKELVNAVAKMDEKAKAALSYIEKQQSEAAKQRALEDQRKEVEYLAREMAGAGAIAGFVLSNIFSNPSLGRSVQTFANAAAAAYSALMTPGIGPLALAGALSEAASSLFGIGLPASDTLLQALQSIQQRLDQIIARLDVIAETQLSILRQLGIIYQAVLSNGVQLNTVRAQLSALASNTTDAHVALDRALFLQSRGNLTTLLTNNNSRAIVSNAALRGNFESWLTSCYQFANSNARNSIQAEEGTQPLSYDIWTQRIAQRNRIDQLIGILVLASAQLGIQLKTIPHRPLSNPSNPLAWAEGANAFMEAKASVPNGGRAAAKTMLTELWWDGWQLRQLILATVNPETIAMLRDKLLASAGLPLRRSELGPELYLLDAPIANLGLAGQIFGAARDWDTQNVPRRTIEEPSGGYSGRYIKRESSGMASSAYTVNFTPDFFRTILDTGALALSAPGGNGWQARSIVVNAPGPWKGLRLVPDDVSVNGGNYYYPAYRNTDPNGMVRSPEVLQSNAMPIAHALIYRPNAISALPNVIQNRLMTVSALDFEFWGSIARVVGSYARWRPLAET